MAELRLDRHACPYNRATGTYWIRELDLHLAPAHHNLLSELWLAVALKGAGVTFRNCGSGIVADTGAFSVVVDTPEELFLLHEIIAGGVYNVVSGRQGGVVLDIGMNVGFASLYFAAQPWVEAVGRTSLCPKPTPARCAILRATRRWRPRSFLTISA